jgi:hypothetical protein
MCNAECPEMKSCCLCQWSKYPYKCNNKKCGDNKDYCAQDFAENARVMAEEAAHEIPEPPYDYVEIIE